MARAFPKKNQVEFSAHDAETGARVHVLLDVTRDNVYYIRRLIRRYTRKGYHVSAFLNHDGRMFSNVFGSDIYTQARRRNNEVRY